MIENDIYFLPSGGRRLNAFLAKLWLLFQFTPLTTFLAVAKRGHFTKQAWETGLVIGAGLAVLETAFLVWRRKILNRLLLGANLYLLVGGVAVIVQAHWLLQLYAQWRATAIFFYIFCVAIFSIIFSQSGYIGVPNLKKQKQVQASFFLLALTMLGAGISVLYHGDNFRSGTLPIIGLISAKYLISKKLSNKT